MLSISQNRKKLILGNRARWLPFILPHSTPLLLNKMQVSAKIFNSIGKSVNFAAWFSWKSVIAEVRKEPCYIIRIEIITVLISIIFSRGAFIASSIFRQKWENSLGLFYKCVQNSLTYSCELASVKTNIDKPLLWVSKMTGWFYQACHFLYQNISDNRKSATCIVWIPS